MLRVSGRVRKILVGVLLALVVVGALVLAVLPEIVRRVAMAQVPKLTGRVLSLADGSSRARATRWTSCRSTR